MVLLPLIDKMRLLKWNEPFKSTVKATWIEVLSSQALVMLKSTVMFANDFLLLDQKIKEFLEKVFGQPFLITFSSQRRSTSVTANQCLSLIRVSLVFQAK